MKVTITDDDGVVFAIHEFDHKTCHKEQESWGESYPFTLTWEFCTLMEDIKAMVRKETANIPPFRFDFESAGGDQTDAEWEDFYDVTPGRHGGNC